MDETAKTPENIIVFGGSFNPPTRAHEHIVRVCLEQPGFDEVWVMPSGERTDKQLARTDMARLAMLATMKREVFRGDPRLRVTDFELRLPQPTQTTRTVGALALKYPDSRFWYVYGADSYATMPDWEGGAELQATLPVLLLPRPGTALPEAAEHVRHLPDTMTPIAEISSTQVREAVIARQDIAHFVSDAVQGYITRHNLYAGA